MLAPRSVIPAIALVLLAAGSAAAQRVVVEPAEPARPAGTYTTGTGGTTSYAGPAALAAPSLTGSMQTYSAPPFVEPAQPAVAAVPQAVPMAATASPAGTCYPKSADTCATEAAQCLVNDFVDDNFDVRWDDQGPFVYRYSSTYSDSDEAAGKECATELYRCLQSPCD